VAVDRVLAEDERRGDLAVRQAGGDEAQHLGLTAGEWRVAVRLHGGGVVEETGEWPDRAMSRRWPSRAKRGPSCARHSDRMQTRYVNGLTIRILRDGDTGTVAALFDRLGPRSRERRFCGAKARLSDSELTALARVDGDHHVLVGYLSGDPRPAGMARLVRAGAVAEVAFEVADAYQRRGIGSTLARELAADARAAGVTELVATMCGDNPSVVSLLKRVGNSFRGHWRGRERQFVVGLER